MEPKGSMKTLGPRLASLLLVGSAVSLAGCGSNDDPEVAAYAELEGIYDVVSIERFAGACDASGNGSEFASVPNLWVAYIVEQGVPDTQLHAHGCSSAEQCRKQAADVQADGKPSTSTDFARYIYSRVSDNGAIDGVGVNRVGIIKEKCRLELEESFVERQADEVVFSARGRIGAEYDPEADGSCANRQDLADQWRTWTDHECTHFDVVRTRFAEDL
jgi:hypothetical protein